MTFEQPSLLRRPTLPDCVHGIVSLDPPTIQCDGCGHEHTERTIAMTAILSGIRFDPRIVGGGPRLCHQCRPGEAH